MTREVRIPRQQTFDAWFPTIVRYAGLILTVVLVVFTIRGHGVDLAAGYVAAAGMILYKTVHDAANGKER
jgi:hypothetical protein